MKRLNFYPYYEPYLRSREKATTLRLRKPPALEEGDEVILSVGWDENEAIDLHGGKIVRSTDDALISFRRKILRANRPTATRGPPRAWS
jgi:hypothetical protein